MTKTFVEINMFLLSLFYLKQSEVVEGVMAEETDAETIITMVVAQDLIGITMVAIDQDHTKAELCVLNVI